MAPTQREPAISQTNLPGADNLGSQYSQAADDGQQSEKKREAAMLYSVAETHMNDEAPEEVLSTIKDAIAIFREIGDSNGLADALRLQMHGYRALAEKAHDAGNGGKEEKVLLEAEATMRDELSKFRACMDKRGEAAMLLSVAEALSSLGTSARKVEAYDYLLDAQDIVREVGDTKLEALIVYERCQVLMKRHRYKPACQAAREAQKLFHGIGDSKMEAGCWFALGQSQINNGRVEDGFVSQRKALSIYRRIGNKKLEGITLTSFAEWYLMEREEFSLSLKAAQEAEAIFKELGDFPRELNARRLSVEAIVRTKDFSKAIALAKEGLDMARESGNQREIWNSISVIATVFTAFGNIEQALDSADELMQFARDQEDPVLRGRAAIVVGQIYDADEQYGKAEEMAEEAIKHFEDAKRFEEELFSAIQFLGRCRIKNDDYDAALRAMHMGRKVTQKMEDTFMEANAMLGMSGSHYGLSELESAKKAAHLSRELYKEEGYQRGEARVLKLALSDYSMEENDFPMAIKYTQEGFRLVEEIGDNKMACSMKSRLAEIYLEDNKPAEAAKAAMEALKLARMEEDKRSIIVVLCTVLSANYSLLFDVPDEDRSGKAFRQSVEKMARYAKEAIGLSVKVKDTELEAITNLWVARMNVMQGAYKEAMVAAESAIELCRGIRDSHMEIDAMSILAQAQDATGDTRQAVVTLRSVLELAYEHEHKDAEVMATRLLHQILEDEGPSSNACSPLVRDAGSKAPATLEAFRPPDMGRVTWFITEKLKEMNSTTDPIDADVPIMDTGLDSLTSVELRTQLQQEFRVNLPSTVMHNYPTSNALARLIVTECQNKRVEWRK